MATLLSLAVLAKSIYNPYTATHLHYTQIPIHKSKTHWYSLCILYFVLHKPFWFSSKVEDCKEAIDSYKHKDLRENSKDHVHGEVILSKSSIHCCPGIGN